MFQNGDIVRYVGDDVAKKRFVGILSFWGPLGYSAGTMGIVEYQREDTCKSGTVMRYRVRVLHCGNLVHSEEMFYDFELEKA